MLDKNIEKILKILNYSNEYKEYFYIFKINIKEIEEIWIKKFIYLILKTKQREINIEYDDINKYLKYKNEFKQFGLKINNFIKISKIKELSEEITENINYYIKINYNKYDFVYFQKNIQKFNKNSEIYLWLDNLKNQDEVNSSYFLDIFNLFKKNNFKINSDFIRYESAYKWLYIIWPKELNFDISEYCNANCIFCNTNGPWFIKNRDSNENKYKQKTNINNLINIVKEADYVWIEMLTIWITWDPFISNALIEPIINEIWNSNLKVWFLTNGYWLKDNIKNIINCKNIESFYINISAWNFDSFKKTRIWDKFKNFINTWQSIKIIKEKRPDIKIKALYIVTPINFKWIDNFINLSIKNNVDEIEIKEVVDYWFDKKLKFDKISINEIINYLWKNKDLNIKSNIKDLIKSFSYKLEEKTNIENLKENIPIKCYNHYLYNSIVRNNIYSCCKFAIHIWNLSKWKLWNFYKEIEKNNKIFYVTDNIEKTIWNFNYLENCSRCFHLNNINEVSKYIKLKELLTLIIK